MNPPANETQHISHAQAVHRVGQYVTAYASDLSPDLIGHVLVMQGRDVRWDADARLETYTDATGTFRVDPNRAERIGSAGSGSHVTLGVLRADLVLQEITWWDTDQALSMELEEFRHEAHRRTKVWARTPRLRVVR